MRFGDFKRGTAGVDTCDTGAGAREMQGESSLIAADVERTAASMTGCRGVVEALIEEGARLLACCGVEVEVGAVD